MGIGAGEARKSSSVVQCRKTVPLPVQRDLYQESWNGFGDYRFSLLRQGFGGQAARTCGGECEGEAKVLRQQTQNGR